MTSLDEALDRARLALARELKIEPSEIHDDTDLQETLELDSFDLLRVIFAVEQEFDVKIEDDSLPEDRRFRSVVQYLLERAQPTGGSGSATPPPGS